ncbi:hypothetical protein BC833DRAFT_530033 [Globomyces pollinis-pini]|nr:hypothetical protein BC833DRAFT_530033 [Globomyces pollinis-pini]
MEASFQKVAKYCSTQMQEYAECIDINPDNWKSKCISEKQNLTQCAHTKVQDIQQVKIDCKTQIDNFNSCLNQHGNDHQQCVEVLQNLNDCHEQFYKKIN